ncbi:MAG: hypothetical protein IPK82_43205 [Polyangiaceae bacterium]|nr:hypothetical protein [Polyangiaceae bacterium]
MLLVPASTWVLVGCQSPPREHTSPAEPAGTNMVVGEPVWPDVSEVNREAFSAMPGEARERIKTSRVPVWLPHNPTWLGSAKVVSKELWTTVHLRGDDATIVVSASRGAHKLAGVTPMEGNRRVRGKGAFVSQNEGIWSANWVESGVSYSVEVECDVPSSASCASENKVLDVANALVFVGGKGRAEVLP